MQWKNTPTDNGNSTYFYVVQENHDVQKQVNY